MYHLNAIFKESQNYNRVFDLTLPQTYVAGSLADFLQEKEKVEPTSFARMVCNLYLGAADGAAHYLGRANMTVFRVEYRIDGDRAFLRGQGPDGRIETIAMGVHSPYHMHMANIEQGMYPEGEWFDVDIAGFIYSPRRPMLESELILVKRFSCLPDAPLSMDNLKEYVSAMA